MQINPKKQKKYFWDKTFDYFSSLISSPTLIQSSTPSVVCVYLTYVLMFCLLVSAECSVCLDYGALLKKFSLSISLPHWVKKFYVYFKKHTWASFCAVVVVVCIVCCISAWGRWKNIFFESILKGKLDRLTILKCFSCWYCSWY